MPSKIELLLPMPPSLNEYYRQRPVSSRVAKTMISDKGKHYRSVVSSRLCELGWAEAKIESELFLRLYLYPNTHQTQDIDNREKALFDALTKAEFWRDDSQVRGVLKHFGPVRGRGEGAVLLIFEEYDKKRVVVPTLDSAPVLV